MRRRKVLIIVLIILALLIVTPVAVWSIWCWSAQRKLDAVLDELRQRGEPLTIAELAPPEIPDEENAAVLYEKAYAQFKALPRETRSRLQKLVRKSKFLEKAELEEARGILNSCRNILDLLHEGARRPKCRFTVDYNVLAMRVSWEHIKLVRNLSQVLRLSAMVNLAERNSDQALSECADLLRLAHGLHNEPMLVAMLMQSGVSNSALMQLERGLDVSYPSESALREVLSLLENYGYRKRVLLAMRGNRCFGLSAYRLSFGNPASWPKVPFSLTGEIPEELELGTKSLLIAGPILINDCVVYLRMMDLVVRNSEKPFFAKVFASTEYRELYKKTWGGNPWSPPRLSRFLLPVTDNLTLTVERPAALMGLGKTGICLRLYRMKNGAYPEKLSALVPEFLDKLPADPFSGKDYIYRREGKGFIVYSVGVNMVDDGGVEDPKHRKAGDIVFRCSQ